MANGVLKPQRCAVVGLKVKKWRTMNLKASICQQSHNASKYIDQTLDFIRSQVVILLMEFLPHSLAMKAGPGIRTASFEVRSWHLQGQSGSGTEDDLADEFLVGFEDGATRLKLFAFATGVSQQSCFSNCLETRCHAKRTSKAESAARVVRLARVANARDRKQGPLAAYHFRSMIYPNISSTHCH